MKFKNIKQGEVFTFCGVKCMRIDKCTNYNAVFLENLIMFRKIIEKAGNLIQINEDEIVNF